MRIADVTVQGDDNDCNLALMAPDEKLYCTITRNLTATDFIASAFTVKATGVSGTPRGVKVLQPISEVIAQITNPNVSTALLSVSVTANTTEVASAGQTVLYTITLVSATNRHGV
jgi:hypothetical protein